MAVVRITAALILLLTVRITAAVIGEGPVVYRYNYIREFPVNILGAPSMSN